MKSNKSNTSFPTIAVILIGIAFLLYVFSLRVYSRGFWSGFGVIALACAGMYLLYWSGIVSKRIIALCLGLIITAVVLFRVISSFLGMLIFGFTLLFPIGLIVGAFLLGKSLK